MNGNQRLIVGLYLVWAAIVVDDVQVAPVGPIALQLC